MSDINNNGNDASQKMILDEHSPEGRLVIAITKNDYQEVKKIVDEEDCKVDFYYKELTPLMFASKEGYIDIVKILLQAGANVHVTTMDGVTAIMGAVQQGHAVVVQMLINAGAKVNVEYAGGNMTPLMLCCVLGKDDMAKILIDAGADVNFRSKATGESCILVASRNNAIKVVELLLKSGANVNDLDNQSHSPLMYAAHLDSPEIVELLLKNGANTELRDKEGTTAIIMAARIGAVSCMKMLIEAKANVNAQNVYKFSPLSLTKYHVDRYSKILKMLQDANAKE